MSDKLLLPTPIGGGILLGISSAQIGLISGPKSCYNGDSSDLEHLLKDPLPSCGSIDGILYVELPPSGFFTGQCKLSELTVEDVVVKNLEGGGVDIFSRNREKKKHCRRAMLVVKKVTNEYYTHEAEIKGFISDNFKEEKNPLYVNCIGDEDA